MFFLSASLFAHTAPLTNNDIVTMVKEGIPDTLIIAKIQASECNFVTDVNGMKSLTEDGVSATSRLISFARG